MFKKSIFALLALIGLTAVVGFTADKLGYLD